MSTKLRQSNQIFSVKLSGKTSERIKRVRKATRIPKSTILRALIEMGLHRLDMNSGLEGMALDLSQYGAWDSSWNGSARKKNPQ